MKTHYILFFALFFIAFSSVGFPTSSYGGYPGYAAFSHYGTGYGGFSYSYPGYTRVPRAHSNAGYDKPSTGYDRPSYNIYGAYVFSNSTD